MNIFKPIVALIAAVAMVALGGPASAVTVTYNFALTAPNGTPVTDLTLYAVGAGEDDVYLSPVVLPVSGVSQLTHTVDFEPTEALVVGISKRTTEEKWDIIMFTSDAYASSAFGQRFGELFPDNRNPRHRHVPGLLQAAHANDADSLSQVADFLGGPDAAAAYFDPYGSFSIIQFTDVGPPIGGAVPEPSTFTLAIFGMLTLGMVAWRRRRA